MAITYVGAGTSGAGTTTAAPGSPGTGGANGDLFVTCVVSKPFGATPTLTNFTSQVSVNSGSEANAVGVGSTQSTILTREPPNGTAGGGTVNVTSGSPTIAQQLMFTKGAGTTWSLDPAPAVTSTSPAPP